MIRNRKVLAMIPARGGSKGVPRKNIREVAGKPLIAWTIEAAKQSQYIDRLILSTDDAEILGVARELGCEVPFLRPVELARDDTPGIAPVLHAIQELPGYDLIVLLQPTSPLRVAVDIDGCLELCLQSNASACVSVTEPEASPYLMYTIREDKHMIPILGSDQFVTQRRQELPPVYSLNGAVYVAQTEWLEQTQTFLNEETVAYQMPKERSVDIDTELDMLLCGLMLRPPREKQPYRR